MTNTPDQSLVGQARVVIYLDGVSEEQIAEVVEDASNALAARGLACDERDEDAHVRSLVGVRAEAFPDLEDDAATKAFLDEHVQLTIPVTGGDA